VKLVKGLHHRTCPINAESFQLHHPHAAVPQEAESFQQLTSPHGGRSSGIVLPSPCVSAGVWAVQLPWSSSAHWSCRKCRFLPGWLHGDDLSSFGNSSLGVTALPSILFVCWCV